MRVRTKRTCLLWQGQELQVLRLFFSRNLYNIHRLAGGHLEFPHHTANILQALPVSAFFNVPHGVANAILLPTIVEYNALADHGKYFNIYNYIAPLPAALEEFTPDMLVDAIVELNDSLGIPDGLEEVGVTKDKFDAMADDAMKSGNIAVNPRSTTKKDVLALYEKAFSGLE